MVRAPRAVGVAVAALVLVAHCALAQTFSYTRSWKPGGKRMPPAAVVVGGTQALQALQALPAFARPCRPDGRPDGRGPGPSATLQAEDVGLLLPPDAARAEHQLEPYAGWRLIDAQPLLHFAPPPTAAVAAARSGELIGDHEEH